MTKETNMIRTTVAGLVAASFFAVPAVADNHSSGDDSMSESSDGMSSGGETIVDIAQGQEDLSTLVEAVTTAELAETLSGEGPFTVFAPTNEAFEALPEGVLDALLMEENRETLTQILQHHVVEGEVMSSDLEDGMEAETMNGTVTVSTSGESPMIGEATVTQADVEASNGVVHIIDSVLVPEGVDPSSLASGS